MIKGIIGQLFTRKIIIAKWQLNLFGVICFIAGSIFSLYILTDKVILPRIFALNDTTKTWTFNTASAGNYTYDTNLITVDDIGAHPVANVNKILNPAFASNNTSWNVAAIPSSGWVEVPGDSNFGTSNFLAMKYEAKCASTGSLGVGLTGPADTTYKVYKENGVAGDQCTLANSRAVVSLASGYPIAYINQTESNTRCGSIALGVGTTAHLTVNNEWMTIARNAEAVNANWSLGVGGSGYMYAGHNDNTPAWALQASTNDANKAAYTDTTGVTEALTSATNTAGGTSGTVGNQIRTLTLSNGAVLWDMAGNVWEWTNNIQSVAINTTAGWVEWNHANVAAGARALYGSNSYLSAQGTGQVYGGVLNNGFLRGGYWVLPAPPERLLCL